MQSAAKLEGSTEKHPITPGEILPARELLADMLLDLGRYEEALKEYEASLSRSANRLNSLYGAGYAAEQAQDKEKATYYYKKLLETTVDESERETLKHAKSFLEEN